MAEDVTVPGAGKVKRQWVYVAVLGAAGIVAYAWWKRRNEAPPSTVDPQTGMDLSASTDGNTGFVNPHPVQSVIDTTGGAITTNPGWVAAVTEKLSSMFELDFIGNVLGKYLSNQPLTSDEASLVRTAWAYQGKPPEGPGTITLTGGGSTPGTGGGAGLLPPPNNFHSTGAVWPDALELHWDAVAGATGYKIKDEVAGDVLDAGPVTGVMKLGLVHNGTYHLRIATVSPAGIGEFSPIMTAHTKN
jgi:hypothetical protein